MALLTETDFNSWRFHRDSVHFNGGKVFFGWGHQCVDQPRLLVIDKHFKADRSTQRSYLIDGKTSCVTLNEALEALSREPELSDDERVLLAALTDDWTVPEERAPLMELVCMGFAEWGRDADNRVTCRRTPAGRRALGRTET